MIAILALWISVIISSVAQISLKFAVRTGDFTARGPQSAAWWMMLLRSPWLYVYLGSFGIATGLWVLALSGLNISYAFPLLSASYILVAILARLFLKETVSLKRWMGIGVICCGVVLIAAS